MPERFENDEGGYEVWRAGHGEGYVLNCFGGRNPQYNLVHRATCTFLWRPSDEEARTTVPKVCSDDLAQLEAAADAILGPATWRRCRWCFRPGSAAPAQRTPEQAELPPVEARHEEGLTVISVPGQPAVWVGAGEGQWKSRIAEAVRANASTFAPEWVDLRFALVRKLIHERDVDNLITPVLESLRDAGSVERGFNRIGTVSARKVPVESAPQQGVAITLRPGPAPVDAEPSGVIVEAELPSSAEDAVKWAVYAAAAELWRRDPSLEFAPGMELAADIRVFIDDAAQRKSSLALLKPCIDGLEPLLGRTDGLPPLFGRERTARCLSPRDGRLMSLVMNVRGGSKMRYAAYIRPCGAAGA